MQCGDRPRDPRSDHKFHNDTVTSWLDEVEPCDQECIARESQQPEFAGNVIFDPGMMP